jgi:mannan endo-1,4-beta-mannosidase
LVRGTHFGTLLVLKYFSLILSLIFSFNSVNFYKDSCLTGAGGKADGVINFYQIHTYSYQGSWGTNAPFNHNAADYNLDKPLIIGEFASVCAENEGIERLFEHAYSNGFGGVLSWQYNAGGECSDDRDTQKRGMTHIRYMTSNGVIGVEIQ